MEIEGKISHSQAAFLTFGSATGTIIYTFTQIVSVTGRPFWVAALLGVLFNIPFAIWILFLGSYKQGGTLFDLLEDGLGKLVCNCIIIIYYFLNISISVCMLNLFGVAVKMFFLPNTPFFVTTFLIVLMCAVFASSGIKYFARLIVLLCTLETVNYFVGFTSSFINEFRIDYVMPIFDASFSQFTRGVILSAGNNAECLLLFIVLVSSTPQTKNHYLAVIKGFLAWSLVLSSAILIMEGCVGQESLSGVTGAGISVASIIQIGSFARGVETFVLITYQYCAIVKTTIFLYCCWTSAKKLFNVPQGKPLLIISAFAVLAAATWINSYNMAYSFSIFLGNYVILPFIIIVCLLCTLSVIIKKKRKGGPAE